LKLYNKYIAIAVPNVKPTAFMTILGAFVAKASLYIAEIAPKKAFNRAYNGAR
jgi:hypothetical protein